MEMRQLAVVRQSGEPGRPTNVFFGGKSGPAPIFSSVKDIVSLGEKAAANAGLYSAGRTFKVVGSVELLSEDIDSLEDAANF